jgi:hypothetical protein
VHATTSRHVFYDLDFFEKNVQASAIFFKKNGVIVQKFNVSLPVVPDDTNWHDTTGHKYY